MKSFLTVGAIMVLSLLVNAQTTYPPSWLKPGLGFNYTNSSNLWPAMSCNVCEIITSSLCFEDFHNHAFVPGLWVFVRDLIQCGSFYVFRHFESIYTCVKNKTKLINFAYGSSAPRVCNNSAQLGKLDARIRTGKMQRVYRPIRALSLLLF